MDLTSNSLRVVTANGTTADWMRKGKMNSGRIFEMRSFLRPRPEKNEFIFIYFVNIIFYVYFTRKYILQTVLVQIHVHQLPARVHADIHSWSNIVLKLVHSTSNAVDVVFPFQLVFAPLFLLRGDHHFRIGRCLFHRIVSDHFFDLIRCDAQHRSECLIEIGTPIVLVQIHHEALKWMHTLEVEVVFRTGRNLMMGHLRRQYWLLCGVITGSQVAAHLDVFLIVERCEVRIFGLEIR